jgi:pimeloyl-ACP methyl ester carboxylesterase
MGHSYGGILARVYGWQYPQESAGLVLVDSLTVGLVDQSEIDNTSLVYYGALAPVWLMQRMGVTRFTASNNFQITGLPPENIPEMAALHSHNQTLDTDITEQGLPGYLALSQASFAASALGDLPVAVLWSAASDATYNRDSMDEVAAYSSNSVVRVIEGSNHFSILGTEEYAQQVSDAVLDVIEAAQTGEPLAQ